MDYNSTVGPMFQIIDENATLCFHSWQLTVRYFRDNPHKMFLRTVQYYSVLREYYDVIHELYWTFSDDEFGDFDIVGFNDKLYNWVGLMELWIKNARCNAYDSINRDTDYLGGY